MNAVVLASSKVAKEIGRGWRKLRRLASPIIYHSRCHPRRLMHRMLTSNGVKQSRRDGTFALYRILGNDLEPRHGKGQTLRSLEFILANEPRLERCEKRWVLNRIYDGNLERELTALIEAAGHTYMRIPFDPASYTTAGLDIDRFEAGFFEGAAFHQLEDVVRSRALAGRLRLKNLYAMNNNGARNAALQDGQGLADWILPWDGNCFLTADAWHSIITSVDRYGHYDYHIVPMVRIANNDDLLKARGATPATDEPQVVFHRSAREAFNPEIPYVLISARN